MDRVDEKLVRQSTIEIPDDVLLDEIWRFLPVGILLKYCSLNRTINSICNDNETWKELIYRDFKMSYDEYDAKEEYKKLYNFNLNPDIFWKKSVTLDTSMLDFDDGISYVYNKLGGVYPSTISKMKQFIINYYRKKFGSSPKKFENLDLPLKFYLQD